MTHRPALVGCVFVAFLLVNGCGGADPDSDDAAFRRAVASTALCMGDSGFTSDDLLARAQTEPAYRRALDSCADAAGLRVEALLDAHRRALVAAREDATAAAARAER